MINPIEEKRRLVQERIAKSFNSGINIAEEIDIEKAWNVGDEKQYQGVTYYVHAFNAKGQPLWRKKKDGGGNDKKADPKQDKAAQAAGFKDYEEMKGWQDYTTVKNLLKKPSMKFKSKEADRKELEKLVADYEKDHADVIAARGGKKKTGNATAKSKIDFVSPTDIVDAVSTVLDKKGYATNLVNNTVYVYEKGKKKTLKNLKCAIRSADDIEWGPNMSLKTTLEPIIKDAIKKKK